MYLFSVLETQIRAFMRNFVVSQRLLSLVGISLGCIAMGLVFTMINTAGPSIQSALGVPLHYMQWMMMAFGIVNCAFLVTSGRCSDIYGRKKIFLIGLCCSGTGMILGGGSQAIGTLVASMCLAGLGNAILLPVSQAMMVTEFPESQKSRAIALWASTMAYAMAIGPLIAGALSQFLHWRWIFWLMSPFFLISALFVLCFTKERKNTVDAPKVDIKGMVLIGICIASFATLITELHYLPLFLIIIFALVVMLSFWLLWKHCHRFPSPILLPAMIKHKFFLAASLAGACLIFYVWATFFLIPIFLQTVRQFSAMTTGLLMLGITTPVILFSSIVGKKYEPQRAWLFVSCGFLFLLFSSFMQIFFSANSSPFSILIATFIYGVGFVLICGPATTAALALVPVYRAGIASGTFATFQEIGGTLGLASVVTVVRLSLSLEIGLQKGGYVLLLTSFIGILCGFVLKPKKTKPEFSSVF